jgi:LuxR family maltose regulon positive regulatory protein
LQQGLRQYALGRGAAVRGWIDWLAEHDPLNGGVAVFGAWLYLFSGQAADADRLARIAERAPQDVTLPDGSTLRAWIRMLRAAMALDVEDMRTDAETALELLAPNSQFRPTAAYLLGSAKLHQGDLDAADRHLADAVELGATLGASTAVAIASATRAIIATRRGRWQDATALLEKSSSVVRAAHLRSYSTTALTHAVQARLAIHNGDPRIARESTKAAEHLLPLLTHALAHLAIQTRLELTRTYVALGDIGAATDRLVEAGELLRSARGFASMQDEAEELSATVAQIRSSAPADLGLTAAELRLLPHLATQQSFREIAETFFLSIHTVKAQVTSIYRKLGASSRTQAIERARSLGLLPD